MDNSIDTKEFASTAGAAKTYFGLPGESAGDFMKQWRMLTDADKNEIRMGLIALGFKIIN